MVVRYSLTPRRVPLFYRETHQIQREPRADHTTRGLKILNDSATPYAVDIATGGSPLKPIAADLDLYAAAIKRGLAARLHRLYPKIGPPFSDSVAVPTFDLPASIHHQADAKAVARPSLGPPQEVGLGQREKMQPAQMRATGQMKALAFASRECGLSVMSPIDGEGHRKWRFLQGGHGSSGHLRESLAVRARGLHDTCLGRVCGSTRPARRPRLRAIPPAKAAAVKPPAL